MALQKQSYSIINTLFAELLRPSLMESCFSSGSCLALLRALYNHITFKFCKREQDVRDQVTYVRVVN